MKKMGPIDVEEYSRQKDEMNLIASYIRNFITRWSTIIVTEARYRSNGQFIAITVNYLSPETLLEICYPGQGSYYLCPKWFTKFDIVFGASVIKYTGLRFLFTVWNQFIYKLAYKKAFKKWPQYSDELYKGVMYTKLVK